MCMIPMRLATSAWLIVSISLICGCGSRTTSRQQSNQPGVGQDTKAAVDQPKRYDRNCDFSERHPLRMGDWLSHVGIVKRVEPSYPPEAKRRRLHGKISVRVPINGKGEVEQACGTGHPLLRDAAEEAALQWLFRTHELNGKRIPYIEATLVFDFVLERSPTLGADP
jgi:TonB family protein